LGYSEPQQGEIHHTGDLIVEGNEIYAIDNVTLYIDGNIIVKDDAKLIIKNSNVILETEFFTQYEVKLMGNAELIAENSLLERRRNRNVNLLVRERSQLLLKNTTCGWDIQTGGTIVVENCNLTTARNSIFFQSGRTYIRDSDVNLIAISVWGEKGHAELSGLKQGYIEHLVIEKIWWRDECVLELQNTIVRAPVIDVGEPSHPSFLNVTIKDSTLYGLWIWFNLGSYAEIKDMKLGHFPYWRMQEEWYLEGMSYDLELINTTVTGFFKLQILGNARIENCSGIQVAPRGCSHIDVYNSIITPNLILRGNDSVILNDTVIGDLQLLTDRSVLGEIIGQGGIHYLEFYNASVRGPEVEVASNYTLMRGEVTFLTEKFVGSGILHGIRDVYWAFGIVEREFPIIVKDAEGKLMPETPIELVDSEGNLMWNGRTDMEGRVFPRINFTRENWDKKWRLTTTAYNLSLSKEIGFFTGTPIIFSFYEIKREIEDMLSRLNPMIKWAKDIGKIIRNVDEVMELSERAKNEFARGNFGVALKLAESVEEIVGFKMDGDPSDWEEIQPLATDPKGDATGDCGDLKSLYAVMDDRYLYLMIEMYDRLPPDVSIDIDMNFDQMDDCIIRLWFDKNVFFLLNRKVGQDRALEPAFSDDVIEVKLPLEYMEKPKIFGIRVYTGPAPPSHIDEVAPRWNKLSRISLLSISVSPANIPLGSFVVVSGSISPPHTGATVTLTYKMPNGTLLAINLTSTALGEFEQTFTPQVAGSWIVKASWNGDLDHEGAESSEVKFIVEEVKLPKPAEFTATNLRISPTESEVKQTITISVKVTNVGEQTGSYTIDLKVAGAIVDTKRVTLSGGESTAVTFELVMEEAGLYDIEVAGLKGSFVVKETLPPPLWGLYATIAAVAIGIATIIWRKRSLLLTAKPKGRKRPIPSSDRFSYNHSTSSSRVMISLRISCLHSSLISSRNLLGLLLKPSPSLLNTFHPRIVSATSRSISWDFSWS
jgi:hypothetical protein